jgi:hypothetical protein
MQCVLALRTSKRTTKKLQLNLNIKELEASAVPLRTRLTHYQSLPAFLTRSLAHSPP